MLLNGARLSTRVDEQGNILLSRLKETLGQVHTGGFLHDLIRVNAGGASIAPSADERREEAASESVPPHPQISHFLGESRIQHRLVSVNADKLVASGINRPRPPLHDEEGHMKFAERFHPNDAVGYAYGLHHDTTISTFMSLFVRALREAPTSDAARRRLRHQATKTR
jgi:hypothetical protein